MLDSARHPQTEALRLFCINKFVFDLYEASEVQRCINLVEVRIE